MPDTAVLQVMHTLQLKKAGPQMSKYLGEVMDWQLEHPGGTAEEAKAWLLQKHQPSS
jgi:tRNA nucleotidyltransferase (CCA-adding enzyme)